MTPFILVDYLVWWSQEMLLLAQLELDVSIMNIQIDTTDLV